MEVLFEVERWIAVTVKPALVKSLECLSPSKVLVKVLNDDRTPTPSRAMILNFDIGDGGSC